MPSNLKQFINGFLLKRLKLLAGALLFALVFSLALMKKLYLYEYLMTSLFTYLQLEMFFWLGGQFFKSANISSKHIKSSVIIRLVFFYLVVLVISLLFLFLVFLINFLAQGAGFENFIPSLVQMELKGFFITITIGFGLGALFFFYAQWSEALKREKQLAQEKLKFQYETLKSQLDPHFLFNNLNTLSSLVRSNPEISEAFIQKLSLVYRYILENHEKQLVPVYEEIRFVREYFYLRKIRDEEKIEICIETDDVENAKILPVSLQILVENALKHNSATRNNPLIITIRNVGKDRKSVV